MASVLADFVAPMSVDAKDWDDPVEGRVLLNEGQLILAKNEDEKETVPLDQIFDINYGAKSSFVGRMPGKPLTIAYSNLGDRNFAIIGCAETKSEKFRSILFKTILNGTRTTLKHPAKVGGRVMSASFEDGMLRLAGSRVAIKTEDSTVTIDLDAVIDYKREQQAVNGEDEPVIVVSHMDEGEALTSIAAMDTPRKLSLLGRYMQRTYRNLLESLQQIQVSEKETEVLTTLYSVGDMDVSLEGVVDEHPKMVKKLLQSLHGKGLVEPGEHNPVLTARGQIVVNEYLERVNE